MELTQITKEPFENKFVDENGKEVNIEDLDGFGPRLFHTSVDDVAFVENAIRDYLSAEDTDKRFNACFIGERNITTTTFSVGERNIITAADYVWAVQLYRIGAR